MTTTAQGKTSSTNEILKTIRAALLNATGKDGSTARDTIDERLFQVRAPDNQPYPYGTMRLTTSNDGRYHGMRLTGRLEVLLYGRPWTQLPDLNNLCDLFDQAMLNYVATQQGLMIAFAPQRDTLPPGSAPVDSETVTIRLVYTLVIWPEYLTRLTLSGV